MVSFENLSEKAVFKEKGPETESRRMKLKRPVLAGLCSVSGNVSHACLCQQMEQGTPVVKQSRFITRPSGSE